MIEHVHAGEIDLWHARAGEELSLEFVRDDSASKVERGRVDARWAALCARNPRLFDGPISAVTSFDPASMRLTWRESSYKFLAVQDDVGTSTWQLSETTLLVAGEGKNARMLLAKRSPSVHTYPGLWEFGPSGGIDPPVGQIDRAHLLSETKREMNEEIGLEHTMDRATIVGVFRDATVRSYDVLVRVPVDEEQEVSGEDWEYAKVRWVVLDDLRSMEGLCPPSAVVASRIGFLV